MIKVQKSMWSVDGKYCYVEKNDGSTGEKHGKELIFGGKIKTEIS